MNRIAIERRADVPADEFAREYLTGHGRPVILTGATKGWTAHKKWGFDFFRDAYGADFVTVRSSLYNHDARLTSLGEFLSHFDAPATMPGIWVDALKGTPIVPPAEATGAYLMDWHVLQRHPELMHDISPPPACIEDWSSHLDAATREKLEGAGREFWSVYIGPAGSLSEVHQDYGGTHSYLVQIAGTKRATLFSPADTPFLYEGEFDPEQPEFDSMPLLRNATAYVADFGPGDLLFTPGGWWHHVRGLTKSITVSHNFHNATNAESYRAFIARQDPALASAITRP